jgi:hypothetical protein
MTTAAGIQAVFMGVGMAVISVVVSSFRDLRLVVRVVIVCSHRGFALKLTQLRNLKLL